MNAVLHFKRVAERGLWSELMAEAHDFFEEGKYPMFILISAS